ncbi:MAG TPA: glucosidase, partial [Lacipirellulaceae bacterium]|nr:glucosidase [Lacipirellulaceae bacterium]
MNIYDTQEGVRLQMNRQRIGHWNRWGPFLAERAWGTVREDYSADGKPWDYFPHEDARFRAYRWNEDGIAGICDRHQYLCFALALWNGHDPFLKERLFGLASEEGNHGEDVKEYYFYLENTPTHSYMKYLYKYPQAEFPYAHLLNENKRRTRQDPEYELVDTGIFDSNRYFDIEIEYAKHEPEDILIRISATNRGPDRVSLHLLPTLWFRNTWIWGRDLRRPSIAVGDSRPGNQLAMLFAKHWQLGEYVLYCSAPDEILFTENETNAKRLFGAASAAPFVKDAFHEFVVAGKHSAVNPAAAGTKVAAYYTKSI